MTLADVAAKVGLITTSVTYYYRKKDDLAAACFMWIYINRGTGYWGPPMRFGVPSEITLIRLVRG